LSLLAPSLSLLVVCTFSGFFTTMATILSLPALKSVTECADFDLAVRPYIPQLLELPHNLRAIVDSDSKIQDLTLLYLNTNPLVSSLAFALVLSVIVLFVSEVNKNYSQVDRLWSILPALYIGQYAAWAHLNGLPTQRLDNVAVVGATWSARLTFNYWRKGGYSIGSEDYRWNIVKDYVGYWPMLIFNITFISFFQNVCGSSDLYLKQEAKCSPGSVMGRCGTCVPPSARLASRRRHDATIRYHLLPCHHGFNPHRVFRRPPTVE
jgi:hypothetical protein